MASTQLTGAAGEYYVAAELARRGWAASITPKGVQRSDILAQDPATGAVVAIQVKTSGGGNVFRMNDKMEQLSVEQNEWVVCVRLTDGPGGAEYYVIPRNVVASFVYVGYRAYINAVGRSGRTRKPTAQRSFKVPEVTDYKGQWEWLKKPTSDVEYILPGWFFGRATAEDGLQPNHPGIEQSPDGAWFERTRAALPGR